MRGVTQGSKIELFSFAIITEPFNYRVGGGPDPSFADDCRGFFRHLRRLAFCVRR